MESSVDASSKDGSNTGSAPTTLQMLNASLQDLTLPSDSLLGVKGDH